jgi:hypothetical protein
MITPKQILHKAWRIYQNRFLTACLKNDRIFPLDIPADKGKSTDDFAEGFKRLRLLMEKEKSTVGYGYTITLKQINTRKHGIQSYPDKICFETSRDFLKFIGKESEFNQFEKDAALIQVAFPQLKDWIEAQPSHVIHNAGKWEDLLKVCRYFVAHPFPNLYVRELPIEVHTKFIEENIAVLTRLLDWVLPVSAINEKETGFEKRFGLRFKEGSVRFRADNLSDIARFPENVTDISIPVSEFSRLRPACDHIFIVENEMNYLTFPHVFSSIIIWGKGNNVQNLKSAPWLKEKQIWYWGDIDLRGFYILSLLRNTFRHVKSLMMDLDTYRTFQCFATSSAETKLEGVTNLTPDEANIMETLLNNPKKNRLEQEHIPNKYVIQKLPIPSEIG